MSTCLPYESEEERKKWKSLYPSIVESKAKPGGWRGYETKPDDWIAVPLTGKHAAPGETFKCSKIHQKLAIENSWHKTAAGYVEGALGFFHRVIYGDDIDESQKVDHINWERTDNRDENLRKVNASLSAFHRDISARNTSGAVGVSPGATPGTWRALIIVDKVRINLGTFKTKKAAIKAREDAEVYYYGEKLNHSVRDSIEKDDRAHYIEGGVGFLALTGNVGTAGKLFTMVSLEDFEDLSQVKWFLRSGHPHNTGLGRLSRHIKRYNGPLEIDHRDRNPLNNQRGNLRVATASQNGINKGRYSNNTSGVRGVSWNKQNKRWEAYIKINRKTIKLGLFKEKKDAIAARKNAEKKFFGEWAPTDPNPTDTKSSHVPSADTASDPDSDADIKSSSIPSIDAVPDSDDEEMSADASSETKSSHVVPVATLSDSEEGDTSADTIPDSDGEDTSDVKSSPVTDTTPESDDEDMSDR